MADDVIGRADYELRAPVDPLKKDLAAAAGEIQKTGAATEAEFAHRSSKWAPVVAEGMRAGIKVVGASAAAMFAIAAKGADQLQQVQNDYQAATGASAEEARRAAKVINQAAGDNQMSLEQVSAAAIGVHNDLGLVGAAADDMTNRIVKFARATKQDAGGAVSALDDILDNWGLTAADAQGIMDKLIVSHQKWGGSIQDNERSLAQLAPALRAANFEVDDAIGLLNLFGAKGLNAEQGAAAFSKALTKVKSPAELKSLIADIAATKDPFERAAKAADLFGAKAGAKLANALDGVNLADYTVSMTEAAGATEKASDALDQGFGPQLRKKISQLGASIRGLGQDWGPVLTGAAAVVSGLSAIGLDKVLAKAWGRVASSGLVKAAVAAAGAAAGVIYTAAAAAGERLATGFAGAWRAMMSSSAVTGAIAATGVTAAGVLSAAATGALIAAPVVVAWAFAQLPHDERTRPGANSLDLGAMMFAPPKLDPKKLEGIFANVDWKALAAGQSTRIQSAGEIIADSLAKGAALAAPGAAKKFHETAQIFTREGLKAMKTESRLAGLRAGEAIAQGILAARQKPVDAFNTLKEMLKHPMTKLAEQTRLLGELTSKELQKGLKSHDPAIKAQARATKAYIIDRLTDLKTGSGKLSKEQAALVNKGLRSKDADIRAAARRIKSFVETPLRDLRDKGFTYGQGFTKGYIRGLVADIDSLKANAALLSRVVKKYMQVRSPSELGAFSEMGGPEGWSRHWMALYTKGLASGIPKVNGILGSIAGFSGPSMLTAATAMNMVATGGAASATVSRGTTIHVPGGIHLHGVGSDVSPATAQRFGRQVVEAIGTNFQQGTARRGLSVTVRP